LTRIEKDSWLLTRPIAHRGLHDKSRGIPENSMGAFRAAVEANLPIELDVQITRDGSLFIMHDFNTKRVTGVDFETRELELAMLGDFRLLGTEYSIPLFSEVLELVDGRVPILVEIKSEEFRTGLLEQKVYEALSEYSGEVAVESFDPLSIRYMRKKYPGCIIGQLSYDFEGKDDIPRPVIWLLKNCKLNFLSHPDFIAYDIKAMPKKFLKPLKDGGERAIIGWTVRTDDDVEFAERVCDNYIFEEGGR
jgi:glycerophosphoryl diester phosphodiesterase